MRSPLLALIKKDVKGYFDQPAAYVLIVPFVAILSLAYFNQLAEAAAEASLRQLFTVDFEIQNPSLPWLLALFVPAATMRLLAEENRDGTLESLLTHPIRGWIVLVSKFLSGFIFVAFAILATIGIPIAVSTAGNLDIGTAAGQYISSLFLSAAFVSIGVFTSSLTRNQIVAFILGLLVTMFLMIMGLDIVAVTLPQRLASLLQALSPVTHFSSIARGVVHLRDVLYFVALVSTFLSATFLVIRGRTLSHKSPQYHNLRLGTVGLIVFSVLIGWSGIYIGGRIDLTEDKLFTMSPATASILDELDDILTIELFDSREPPTELAPVSRDVSDFLEDFVAASDGRVKLVRRYPALEEDQDDPEGINDARKAQNAGIGPRQFNRYVQGKLEITAGFLGLAMTYIDQRKVIPAISGFEGFEYQLASLAHHMLQEDRKTVGFLTGHGEAGPTAGFQTFAGLLSQSYNIVEVDASENPAIDLSEVDVLVVGGPTRSIPDETADAVRQYLVNGGKAMFMIQAVLVDTSRWVATPNRNNFGYMAEEFGAKVEDDLVIDVRFHETLTLNTRFGSILAEYPFWPRVPVVENKVAGDVESALLAWASSIGTHEESKHGKVEVIPILRTTEFAANDRSYGDIRPREAQILSQLRPANFVQSDMAVAIQEQVDIPVRDAFRLVVFGDVDWLSDGVIQRAQQNWELGLNLIDWLAQEETLAAVRSKVVSSRALLFTSTTHKNIAWWVNIAGVPLLVVAIGLLRSVRRRRFGLTLYGQRSPRTRRGRRDDESSREDAE